MGAIRGRQSARAAAGSFLRWRPGPGRFAVFFGLLFAADRTGSVWPIKWTLRVFSLGFVAVAWWLALRA